MPKPKLSYEEQKQRLKEKQARLQAQFQKVAGRQKAEDRKADTRRKVLAGAVVLKACETDTALKEKVWGLMEKNLTMNKDRAVFGFPLRPESPSSKP